MVNTILLIISMGIVGSLLSIEKPRADVHPLTGQRYGYSKKYEDFALKNKQNSAVVVVGYNRPHYFEKVLCALAANPESKTLPFFFILDGGSEAKQSEYTALIKKSGIRNTHIIKRPVNFGLHFNIISGLRFLFDWCQFDRIIHFEDDVVVTPSYLGLMLRLDRWAHEHYDNIGAVQGFRPCRLSKAEKHKCRAVVAETPGLWLGYCLRRSVWDDIKDIMYEYEENFLGRKRLPAADIKQWMIPQIEKGPLKRNIPADRKWESPFDSYFTKLPEMGVGQCGMLTMSLFLRGYARLTTLANRAVTIGVEGANYQSKKWHNHFKGVSLDDVDGDARLSEFEPLMKIVY